MTKQVKIIFPNPSEEFLKVLKEAEIILESLGVSFDKGYDFEKKQYEWILDWSLTGATVEFS